MTPVHFPLPGENGGQCGDGDPAPFAASVQVKLRESEKVPEHVDIGHRRQGMMTFVSLDQVTEDVKVVVGVSVELVSVQKFVQEEVHALQFLIASIARSGKRRTSSK